MKSYKIGILYGDGIGAEIMEATLLLLKKALQKHSEVQIEWQRLPMGWEGIRTHNHPVPIETLHALEACHSWIMGPQDNVSYPDEFKHLLNPSGHMRSRFDLYANIRPARNYPAISSLVQQMDLVTVRENTEGFYSDRNMYQGVGEYMPTPDIAITTGVFTRQAAERIAHTAFQLAQSRRHYVSIVHKANVIKMAHGLFLDTCQEVAKQYPNVRVDDYHIDAMAAHLVRRPADFDVIVTTNMFGDILSDLVSELVGSLGMGGSINAGKDRAMAQAAHGAAPDIAGQGIANPVGLMHSAMLLFEWMGQKYSDPHLSALSHTIDQALTDILTHGPLTRDLGGDADTQMFTQTLVSRV